MNSNHSNQLASIRHCVVCGSPAPKTHYGLVEGHPYCRCDECGLIYQSFLPTNREFLDAYTGGALKTLKRRLLTPFLKLDRTSGYATGIKRARKIFNFAESLLGGEFGTRSNRRMLDVGCNKGYVLAAADERGFDVWGIEYVPELTVPFRNTYSQYRSQVFSQKLSELRGKLEQSSFDLITAIDVIEHFEDPVVDLKFLRSLLRKTGRLTVQTPDAGCENAIRQGPQWGAMKPAEHLHLFNQDNFTRFALDCGFGRVTFHPVFEEADGNFVAVLEP